MSVDAPSWQPASLRLTTTAPGAAEARCPDGPSERRTAPRASGGHPSRGQWTAAAALSQWTASACVEQPVRRVFVLTAVRHDDALTAALREIGAKPNKITESAPLLATVDDADLAEALHEQKDQGRYLLEDRWAPLDTHNRCQGDRVEVL